MLLFDFDFLRFPKTYDLARRSWYIMEKTTWHQANVSVRRMNLRKLTETIAKWQGETDHLQQLFVVDSRLF